MSDNQTMDAKLANTRLITEDQPRRPSYRGRSPIESMVLKRGIKIFLNWDDCTRFPKSPSLNSSVFSVVYCVADPLRLAVSELRERGVTPNVSVATAVELNRKPTGSDIVELDARELEQVD